jgi:hypothetical protein
VLGLSKGCQRVVRSPTPGGSPRNKVGSGVVYLLFTVVTGSSGCEGREQGFQGYWVYLVGRVPKVQVRFVGGSGSNQLQTVTQGCWVISNPLQAPAWFLLLMMS